MTLGFSTHINGKPNHFPEKILSGMLKSLENDKNKSFIEVPEYIYTYGEKAGYESADTILQAVDSAIPKLHTMREDPHDRWKAGMDIHMVINNRTKNRFQFAPVVKCVSVQEIVIKYAYPHRYIFVDGKYLHEWKDKNQLAINDGFDSVEDFFAYFSSSCTRKLIHWTDLRY